MFAKLTGGLGRSNPSNNQDTKITPVDYPSNPVEIPSSFLTGPPENPIVTKPIDFASTSLPQYAPHTALILENVLSPAECAQLLTLAEASVPTGSDGNGGAGGKGNASASPWRPAKVSLGPGWEAAAPGYRESDRIVWDQQTVVDRLWERCAAGSDGLRELLAVVPETFGMGPGRWEFRRFNDRMRFLKYSPGQFFKPHTDGPYFYDEGGAEFQTHYTVHLYLNDSAEADPASKLVGGATSFLSRDKKNRVDVNPRAGSVLIFQHSGLFHEGAIVKKGVKFTMRTDILYEWVPKKKGIEEKASD